MTLRSLGRYEIVGHLATGGMADVWLARSRGIGGFTKLVALKTLLPEYSVNGEFVEMLIREASVAAQLIHPGIVQILDLGSIDGKYFMAMEYVPGLTLRHVLHHARAAETRVPIAPVLAALAEVCDALHYAHGAGLIHRDISPENIMITELGHAKVLDFGIVADRGAPVTRVGRVKGKYAYMSPEVFSNAPQQHSRDIWAVGVVLYEMLCGQRPFDGDNDAVILMRIVHGEMIPPRVHDPSIPKEAEWTIQRCLSPRAEDRPSSAHELASMLRVLVQQAVARGESADISQLLAIGRTSIHAPIFGDETDEPLELSLPLSTGNDICAVLEPSKCAPSGYFNRSSRGLRGPKMRRAITWSRRTERS